MTTLCKTGYAVLAFLIAGSSGLHAQQGGLRMQNQSIPRHMLPPEMLPQAQLTPDERATIQRCLKDLQSPESETRAGAVMILGKYDHPLARQPIINALSDPSPRVRRTALVSVAEWNRNTPYAAVEPALRLIDDEDVEIRRMASGTLGILLNVRQTYLLIRPQDTDPQLPSDIRSKLTGAFLDDDPVVRRNLIRNYENLRLPLPEATWQTLLLDTDRSVRLTTLPKAARFAPPQVVLNAARELAQSEDRAERLQLARELDRFNNIAEAQAVLEDLRDDADDEVASEALIAQLRTQPSEAVVKTLLSRLIQGKMSQAQGLRTLRLLRFSGFIPPAYFEQLILLKDSVLRQQAVEAFLDSGLAEKNPQALALFAEDHSQAVRDALIDFLEIHPNLLKEPLREALIWSPHEEIRQGLVRVSRQMQPREAAELLNELLLDETMLVRANALQEMVLRGLPDWQKMLSASLLDPDDAMQRVSLSLILEKPYPGDTEALQRFLKTYPKSPLSRLIRIKLGQMKEGDT